MQILRMNIQDMSKYVYSKVKGQSNILFLFQSQSSTAWDSSKLTSIIEPIAFL
jgi:hypothetical protein